MKLIKTASGKQQLKISRKEWEDIGEKAGWMKLAEVKAKMCPKCNVPMEIKSVTEYNVDTGYNDHNVMYECPKCKKQI